MKARLSIQQLEFSLTGGSGRVITAEASGGDNVRKALRIACAAIAAPAARRADPDTSHAAAAAAIEFSGKHAAAIYAWLADHPEGGTKDEIIAAGTGIDAIAVARRIKELRDTAGVYDSGERRKSPTGRACVVWKAPPCTKEYLA